MVASIKNYFGKLLASGAVGSLLLLLLFLLIPAPDAGGLAAGYLLSYLFVASNFFVIRKIELGDQKKFLKIFFASLVVRFVLVVAGFVSVLAVTNFNQIFFTVSFIISYIFHSIIEIIFINKILENRHEE
ncbi:MAG: hypothetical protein R3224_02745 [Balneolaceae bacterium]|nr:hypothetical protein [Balneolaceae bacterium]